MLNHCRLLKVLKRCLATGHLSFMQCCSTRTRYSYSSTTRVPFSEYSYSYSYSNVEVLVLDLRFLYSDCKILGTRCLEIVLDHQSTRTRLSVLDKKIRKTLTYHGHLNTTIQKYRLQRIGSRYGWA